ncbi:unnamed protein product [Prorocentrum cordatum]|uniref:Glucose-methanol-choline oxidoreductase N-terminal domain-containing protein n=1 Tax=Prorocentrum cordatum TaxID=2364126 RepID=A0ABN9UB82_9DINO|nr:unnamed protein product [Polarella glacialis]
MRPFLRLVAAAFEGAGVPFRAADPAGAPAEAVHGVHGSTWLSLACPRGAAAGPAHPRTAAELSRCARQSAYSGLVAPLNRSLPNLVVRPRSLVTGLRWGRRGRAGASGLQAAGAEVVELRGSTEDWREREVDDPPVGWALSFDGLGDRWASRIQGRYHVGIRRAVVAAAGAVGSPALLHRSGVGPPEALKLLGKTLRLNASEVGQGLRDRVVVATHVSTRLPCSGEARSSDVPLLFAFFNFSGPNVPGATGPSEAELNMLDDCVDGFEMWSLRFILQRTLGSGQLHVRSPHPLVSAQAELSAGPEDLHRVVAMLRWFHERVQLNEDVAAQITALAPSLEDFQSDRMLGRFVRSGSAWYLHPSGSLSAGAVDSDLRVRGTGNVYVADASAMSRLPTGHPDASIRMLGDALAHRLLRGRRGPAAGAHEPKRGAASAAGSPFLDISAQKYS